MAFKCDKCKQPQPAGTKAKKVVTETRDMVYRNGDERGFTVSHGSEIAKEITVCPDCA